MASFGYNAVQTIPLNQGAVYNAIAPCPYGYVYHEDETSNMILKGVSKYPCKKMARYKVTVDGNIALPTGATVTPIAIALVVNGDVRQISRAIFTPAAVGNYGNVVASDFINVPIGCCFNVSIDNVVASEEDGYTPAANILMQNLNINVDRVL